MNKSIILVFFIVLIMFIAGCENIDVSELSDEDLERISEKAVVCDKPYIRVGMECCLDQNDNKICDKDETEVIQKETEEKPIEKITPPQKMITPADDIGEVNVVPNVQKSLNEMMPLRQDIPTEFTLDPISDYTFRETQDIPGGFDSGVKTSGFKWVGSNGGMELDFHLFKFDSEDSARKEYNKRKDFMINGGGYTELDITVPSGAECFSFLEDYGFEARFAISYCFKDNFEYEVTVTAGNTYENPKKYLKGMITLLDNKINR